MSSASGVSPSRRGCPGGHAASEHLARAAVAAAVGEHGRDQVAHAGGPGEGLAARALMQRELVHLGEDAAGGGARVVHADARGSRGRQGGDVLGTGGELGADDVVGLLDPGGRPCEQPTELPTQSASSVATTRRRRPRCLCGMRGSGERCHAAREDALAHVLDRAHAERRTRPFEQTTTAVRGRCAATSPTAAGRSAARRRRRDPRPELDPRHGGDLCPRAARCRANGGSAVGADPPACSRVRQPSSTSSPARASRLARAVPIGPAPTTAAVRSAGRPPSHSYWSSTHGQIRAVTSLARCADGCSTRGKVSGRPSGRAPSTAG